MNLPCELNDGTQLTTPWECTSFRARSCGLKFRFSFSEVAAEAPDEWKTVAILFVILSACQMRKRRDVQGSSSRGCEAGTGPLTDVFPLGLPGLCLTRRKNTFVYSTDGGLHFLPGDKRQPKPRINARSASQMCPSYITLMAWIFFWDRRINTRILMSGI